MGLAVGDILKRKSGGGAIKLLGIDGAGYWVATNAEGHSPPFRVSSAELVEDFHNVSDPTPPPAVDEAALRQRDREANDAAVRGYRLSPEARAQAGRNERRFAEAAARAAGADSTRSPEDRFREIAEAESEAE